MEKGLVDEELIDLLLALNENENLFTTSSCAGRITIGCNGKNPEDKRGTEHLLTSHSPISVYDVFKALDGKRCQWLWIKASHPLLDIGVKDIDLAMKLVSLAKTAGFKYSGIQPSNCCYRVIVRGSDNIQYPLSGRENGHTIAKVVSHANRFLLNGKLKLVRFVGLLEDEGIINSLEDTLFYDEELL
ncbi:hypothetical protein IPA_02610 [Ignicoccus pacificus DSM 13166]|uniref:tRNA(Phe) 7-((3-amino-3-carboxypropyl)-4-demethylwyosine(37)-N(4))-methyltransferase n=1 Tax=Ignicoccus pacificus DSM 13166 TaxID=940294 RepID=A0A977KAS3_9CREN|nr:hypothetical protein IPA_02610 [Ignicoccus pacificus DSM 13166]